MKIITIEEDCLVCSTNQIAVYWNKFLHKPQEYCVQCKTDERKAKRRVYMKKRRVVERELNKQAAQLAAQINEALVVQNITEEHRASSTSLRGLDFLRWRESL